MSILVRDEDGADMYIPIPIEKFENFPYSYHTQSMQGFSVKTGTESDNNHGTSLFVISNEKDTILFCLGVYRNTI